MEVLSHFLTIIMLSAAISKKIFFKSFRHALFYGGQIETQNPFQPSMGTWVHTGLKFASFFIGETTKLGWDSISDLFRNPPRGASASITNSRIWSMLKEVSQIRNLWRGHSGRGTNREILKQLEKLEHLSDRIRWVISDSLRDLQIVLRETEDRFQDGWRKYHVLILRGAGLRPEEETIEVTESMENNQLYMIGLNVSKPVKTLPLMLVRVEQKTVIPVC
jgi:hypothetical protein